MGQALSHIAPERGEVEIPAELARLMTIRAMSRFRMLATADQRHLIAVAESLARTSGGEDLVTAGLLHDIGKAQPGLTVRLHDRVAKVLLQWTAPSLFARITERQEPPRLGAGLWVLARHAQAGTEFARKEGYNARLQWLIAHHESRNPDACAGLRLLIATDEASTRSRAR